MIWIFIGGAIALSWVVPALAARRFPTSAGVSIGVVLALALGVVFIWLVAEAAGGLGLADPAVEFERGLNAWKIMLLLAPAVGLHVRRRTNALRAQRPPEETSR